VAGHLYTPPEKLPVPQVIKVIVAEAVKLCSAVKVSLS